MLDLFALKVSLISNDKVVNPGFSVQTQILVVTRIFPMNLIISWTYFPHQYKHLVKFYIERSSPDRHLLW